jgi:hypothetical protein
MDFKLWLESSLGELYNSTVAAFPETERRQHSIDPVRIEQMSWIPYRGMNTLLIRGLANNAGRHYHPLILFKAVNFTEGEDHIQFTSDTGSVHSIAPISYDNNQVLVRCSCPDMYWRGVHYLKLDNSLYGRDRSPYERKTPPPPEGRPYANPLQMPIMCKHLIKLSNSLLDAGLLI